jgi:dihydrofolate synthase/folylpolyglutamate synthase
MSYAQAMSGLLSLAGELVARPGATRREFRLQDMRQLLAELGDPQRRFPAVLIAGTNGKGSTAATLAGILATAGYRVGLFTSPHLARVNERVRILDATQEKNDTGEIADDAFAALYFQVSDADSRLVASGQLPAHSSFFEAVTALAFLHFAAEAVDIAVLEVGMGGRLDATNVVEPLVSVIADISLDHTEWLGPTITAIAREKAGILRENGVMVTLPQHPEANQAIGEIAVALNVRGVNAADYIPATEIAAGRNRYALRVMDRAIEIDSPLAGRHQQRNLALAIAAAVELRNNHGYTISPGDVALGVKRTVWPGRLERFAEGGGRPDVLLDVAHNPAGAWSLRAGISALLGDEAPPPMTLVFGCLRDKALEEMEQILFPLFDRVVVTEVDSPRTASKHDLLAAAAKTGTEIEAADGARAALDRALSITPAGGLIVVAGSVYLVGRIRALLTGSGAEVRTP